MTFDMLARKPSLAPTQELENTLAALERATRVLRKSKVNPDDVLAVSALLRIGYRTADPRRSPVDAGQAVNPAAPAAASPGQDSTESLQVRCARPDPTALPGSELAGTLGAGSVEKRAAAARNSEPAIRSARRHARTFLRLDPDLA
ncbi:hypothetical protein SAMN05216551_102311 [Chitinasiproducens palmae]|uniref:Uncharacterized protein n=1 Tax=Chitinasiproducens palmae TaxID=1770053 RepID=A0A1H2PM23_9BURK|nr:hypothetical protein SAMN05216551_102311 [Chitinasiproducens palmae]